MKKVYSIILFMLLSNISLPQVSIRGGMGINLISIPSLKDYLNDAQYAPVDNQIGSFATAIIFSGEVTSRVAENYDVGFELAYLYNSYNFYPNGQYNLTYSFLMPTITNYYVIDGQGYNFKFGGGIGLRFTNVNETYLPKVSKLKSFGFGFLLRAIGNTALSSKVYANITGDIRYDINGTPKDNGVPLQNLAVNNSSVTFNSFSLGLTLGLTYIF